MSAAGEAVSVQVPEGNLPPVTDQIGEALLGAAMAMGVTAVALTLFATAPAFRPGRRGAALVAPRPRLAGPLATITGGAVVAFVAYLGYTGRCGGGCIEYGRPLLGGREAWWRLEQAWQWGAQLALASVGLAAAAIALVLAARGMRGVRPFLRTAHVLFASWALAALVLPVAVELASG